MVRLLGYWQYGINIPKMAETSRTEYKQELTDTLEKEVVAFFNYHEGGMLYTGIDKRGEAIGVADPDGDMLKIKDRLKNNISPSYMDLFDVISEAKNDEDIIKLLLPVVPKNHITSKSQACQSGVVLFILAQQLNQCPIK